MIEAHHLILLLISASVITALIATIFIIIKLNRSMTKNIMSNITSEYNSYKEELNKQNHLLMAQMVQELELQNKTMHANNSFTKDKDLINIFIKLREAIKENCTIAMNQIGASRLAIYLLHNGTHTTHGISFIKMSCICEKVAIGSGIRERIIEHSNIPINLFDEMMEKLITYNRYIIMNTPDDKTANHELFLTEDKITYTQLVTIYDINNNMIGFVCAEMDTEYSKKKADEEKEKLDALVKQLVPVLSYSNYNSI